MRSTQPFAIVPLDLVAQVSGTALAVYCVLAEAASQDGESWPSLETIGKRIGKSTDSARRGLHELRDAGWVVVRERYVEGRQTSNLYTVKRGVADMPPSGVADMPGTGVAKTRDKPDPEEPDPKELFDTSNLRRRKWFPSNRHIAVAKEMGLTDDEINTIGLAVDALEELSAPKRGERFVTQCMYQAQFNKRNPRKDQQPDWLEQWAADNS